MAENSLILATEVSNLMYIRKFYMLASKVYVKFVYKVLVLDGKKRKLQKCHAV